MKKIKDKLLYINNQKWYKRTMRVVRVMLFIMLLSYLPMWVTNVLFFGGIIFLLLFQVYRFRLWINNIKLSGLMNNYNTITYGFKGRGKDLLTQISIVTTFRRKYKRQIKKLWKIHENAYNVRIMEENYLNWISKTNYEDNFENWLLFHDMRPVNYLSNIDYGYGAKIITLKELELTVRINNKDYYNDFKALIDGKCKPVKKILNYEGLNTYWSDSGILLPNTETSYLDKKYTTFPVLIALSRQLYDMCFNFNTQALGRIWKKFREQQDYYIKAVKTVPPKNKLVRWLWSKLPYFKKRLLVKIITYEKYESAEKGLLPLSKTGLMSKNNMMYNTNPATLKEIYEAENGKMVARTCVIKRKHIKYDTRYFHEVMFGHKFKES